MMPKTIQVDVVFPRPDEQRVFSVTLPENATVQDAIEAAGILGWYPEIDLSSQKVGIFSKLAALTQTLKDRDRVEIYRPVTADPKTMRKKTEPSAVRPAPTASDKANAATEKTTVSEKTAE